MDESTVQRRAGGVRMELVREEGAVREEKRNRIDIRFRAIKRIRDEWLAFTFMERGERLF